MQNGLSKILIIDDHQIVITGIKLLLKEHFPHAYVEGLIETENLSNTLRANNFDLVILDINIPGIDTHNIIHQVKSANDQTKILIFSMNSEEIFALRYLKLGADGYLNKEASESEITKAIIRIMEGKRYLSPHLMDMLSDDVLSGKSSNTFDALSPREFEIMKYLTKGMGIKEISAVINLHHSTVSTHKARIYEKTGTKNIVELKELAVLNNIRF